MNWLCICARQTQDIKRPALHTSAAMMNIYSCFKLQFVCALHYGVYNKWIHGVLRAMCPSNSRCGSAELDARDKKHSTQPYKTFEYHRLFGETAKTTAVPGLALAHQRRVLVHGKYGLAKPVHLERSKTTWHCPQRTSYSYAR